MGYYHHLKMLHPLKLKKSIKNIMLNLNHVGMNGQKKLVTWIAKNSFWNIIKKVTIINALPSSILLMNRSKNKLEARSLKDVLKDIITQKPLKKGVQNIRICNSWRKVMGENIEKYTTQVRFSHNILYVNIKSAPLKMELKFQLEIIRDRLNSHLGGEFIRKVILN